ncbi:hypothetical protein [Brevundimonas diminuta]|uniref:hypothetical protein n=1 Tax=Brevundimonas diminuta TaxID=293 RepID=UPI0030FB1BB4
MAVSIRIPGASFANPISRTAPFWADCTALYLFGENEALSKRNLKTGADAAVVGAPAYGDNYAVLGQTAGFVDAAPARSIPYTHCVVTTIGSGNNMYAGHGSATSATGGLLGRGNLNALGLITGATRVTTPYQSAGGYNFLATSYDGATAKVHTALAGAVTTASAAIVVGVAANPLRIGGMVAGSFNIAAEMSFNRALTNAEVPRVLEYLSFLCGKRGVVVA